MVKFVFIWIAPALQALSSLFLLYSFSVARKQPTPLWMYGHLACLSCGLILSVFLGVASLFFPCALFFGALLKKIQHQFLVIGWQTFLLSFTIILITYIQTTHYQIVLQQLATRPNLFGEISDVTPGKKKGSFLLTLNIIAPFHTRIRLFTQKNSFYAGDKVMLKKYSISDHKNQQIKWFEEKEQIAATLFEHSYEMDLIDRPSLSILRAIQEYRLMVFTKIQKALDPKTFAYVATLFLGHKRHYYYDEMRTRFSTWGLTHLLARSGAHIMIIASLWGIALSVLPISWPITMAILLILIVLYALCSWPSVSFYRAFYFCLLYYGPMILRRPLQPLYVFFLILCLTIITTPLAVYGVDFQLSFGLTFVLLCNSYLKKKPLY